MSECFRRLMQLVAIGCVALGSGATAATQVVQVNANVNKPLSFSRLQDLDLGMITLGPGTWSGAAIAITQAGVLSCTSTKVVCTGAPKAALYNVQGSNKMVVHISAPVVTLVNQRDASKTLTLVLDSPGTVTLTSSGVPGVDFGMGGSIALDSNVPDGVYVGTLNVTVDY